MEMIKDKECKYKCIRVIMLMIILVIILLPVVKAGFVCGQVRDSEEMSAHWFKVRISHLNDDVYTDCEISPADNKYCCDSEAIPGRSWRIGDVMQTEIFENESGYVAGPVIIKTTGEGFDIMPEMQLEKAIKIHNKSKLVVSDKSEFLLNADFKEPYNYVELERQGNKIVLCEDCGRIEEVVNADFGMNSFKLLASNGNRVLSEDIKIAIIKDYGFDRDIQCRRCRGNRVRSNRVVNMGLIVNLSHSVEGLELKEYVPVEWEILNTDGEIKEHSDTHNMITWNISGKDIIKKYKVKAPRVWFFPEKYIFRTELENQVLNEEEVIVSWWVWFFPREGEIAFKQLKKKTYSRVMPSRPLVVKPKGSEIERVVIFPNKNLKNVDFVLIKEESNDIGDLINSYSFESNIENKDVDEILIEFKIEKEFLQEKSYESISLYYLGSEGGWKQGVLNETGIENEIHYKTLIPYARGVAISGNKKGFWSWLY
jgi:hypothetical protein